MNNALMFSTGKDDWATPPEVFDPLNEEFRFTLDAAANKGNAKCQYYFGPDHDLDNPGVCDALLLDEWPTGERIWCNPPYSRGLSSRFLKQAGTCAIRGGRVVMLLPARTDTVAFHAWVWELERHKLRPWVREVRFLKGRIKFVGAPASAPFPSMVVVFGR